MRLDSVSKPNVFMAALKMHLHYRRACLCVVKNPLILTPPIEKKIEHVLNFCVLTAY